MTRFFKNIILFIAVLIPHAASAQFYVTGDDPGRSRWYSIETDHFKVIYPEGTDSLARIYARKIEGYRIPVSLTSGYVSGEGDGKKMPVVLHAYNAANGSVAWAPKRMDLFTVPSAYEPDPMPWSTMLSLHESRHVTQMQFGMTGRLEAGNWFFGEMWNILASLVYPGISTMEGDAVITETAWTRSGRGRTADFLNYYRVAFDQGDFRKWYRWRFVSQKYNAPDYYSLGYLTIGGFRYLYDCPEYMSDAYHLSAGRPLKFTSFRKTAEKIAGKGFNEAFMEVCDTMNSIWKADAEARMPFIPAENVSAETRTYTDYTDLLVNEDGIYAIMKGHTDVPSLVRIGIDGKPELIRRFAYEASHIRWSPYFKRIYWSESGTDERWSLQSRSKIMFIESGSGKIRSLKNKDLLFNPAPAGSQAHLATVKYEVTGRSSLEIISGINGKSIRSFAAPDTLQLVESAWIGDDVYATAISDDGYGIYQLSLDENIDSSGKWEMVLSPQPVRIKDLSSTEEELIFTCDRTGVNELYHLDPVTGTLTQKTSTRYGASDFQYSTDGEWLYYSSQTLEGMRIFRTRTDSLLNRKADFTQYCTYPVAEKLAAQEREAAARHGWKENKDIRISEPERYRKLPHMFNIHSWAPVYVNVDNIMNMSYDYIWQAASLGASGIIQNRLATAVGEFGYSAHKDPYNPAKWRHSGHAELTYSGLYPVFEASVDFNDRAARQYKTNIYQSRKGHGIEVTSSELTVPYIEGRLSVYLPLKFSSGGWYRGFIPRVSYRIGNDKFDTGFNIMEMEEHQETVVGGVMQSQKPVFKGRNDGKNTFMHSISGSMRFYSMLNTPNSAVYPKWGIGLEAGVSTNIESNKVFSPMGYIYAYGYIPGIIAEQGIRLTARHQTSLDRQAYFSQTLLNTLPRGLSGNGALMNYLSIRNRNMTLVTADYAIPVFIGDISIGGRMFAIKRLVITPHFDYTFLESKGLLSAGASLILDLHSILAFDWPCSIGVTASYNGGPAFDVIAAESGIRMKHCHVGPTFNVTF